jgi:hypothetical protein
MDAAKDMHQEMLPTRAAFICGYSLRVNARVIYTKITATSQVRF